MHGGEDERANKKGRKLLKKCAKLNKAESSAQMT